MSLNVDCENHEALVDYLYDECGPEQRAAFAAHLAGCARCAAEADALRETRGLLAEWTPPSVPLGFRIVSAVDGAAADVASGLSRKDNVLRPAGWWNRSLPAWAQAAAAVMIFAAGLGLGALRGASAPPDLRTSAPSDQAVSAQDLAALEQRLRAEMQEGLQQARADEPAPAPATAPVMTSSVTLQQVRNLIAESEQRQQRELTLRTAEVIRDFDTQRRGDLARIQQTFGRLEGATGAEVEQQRRMLDYLLRVSQRPAQ
jgi:hypothetical protein